MADTPPTGGAIDPTRLDIIRRPCGDCPPDWSRLASLARLALAVARADLERERQARADRGESQP